MESGTQKALRLMREQGLTQYAAAKQAEVTPQAVNRAIKREEAKKVKAGQLVECHCCGSLVNVERITGNKFPSTAKELEAVYQVDRLPRLLEMMKADLAKGIDPTTKEWIEDIEKYFDSI